MVAPIIYAKYTTEDVLARLAEKREFRLLNVFDHACNLLDERDGTVISLLSNSEHASPFSIHLPLDKLQTEFVEGVYRSDSRLLKTPRWLIELEQVSVWNPRLIMENISQNHLETLVSLSKEALFSAHDSLAQPYLNLPPPQSSLQARYFQEAGESIARLLEFLPIGDFAQISPMVKTLAGSGFGLTPSGDDWLLGCILALQITKQSQLAKKISILASQFTTPLSAAYLKMAGEAKYSEAWHECLKADNLSSIQAAIQGILAYGHSSGADALTGFVQSLESLLL